MNRSAGLPARAGPASKAAVSLAVPQNTGSASAGITRAAASTQRFGDQAATALETAKMSRIATKSFLRSICDSQAVSTGPNSITTTAKSVTSCPAVETETTRSRASAGRRPTIMNSVVTMTNAAIARITMEEWLY